MKRLGALAILLIAIAGPAAFADNDGPFGAIAYSTKHESGFTVSGYGSEAEAEADAIKTCREHAPDDDTCSIAVWWSNACGALAKASDGSWGTAWGGSPDLANQTAMGTCRDYGGKDCKVQITACSPGGYFNMPAN